MARLTLTVCGSTVQSVLSCVQCTTLDAALGTLSANIGARRMRDKHFSTYRDIMFLAFAAMGRDNIDLSKYRGTGSRAGRFAEMW